MQYFHRKITLIFLTLIVGIASAVILVYFYIQQKEFTKQHREFLVSISSLENTQGQLTYHILQNSLFAYHNQDEISITLKKLQDELQALKNTEILQNKNYLRVAEDVLHLEKQIQNNIFKIEDFLILNAGIKNSLVFLTRHVENASLLKNKRLFIESSKILKRFNDALRMQDIDYIQNNKTLLEMDTTNRQRQNYIERFNLHANYFASNYPRFLQIASEILNSNIGYSIDKTRVYFSETALSDFEFLDILALIIFSVFVTSFSVIIILFIKYRNENHKLIETTDSLEYSLTYDQLTNLYNRKAFEKEIKVTAYPHLLIININGFKHINDVYGNHVGNEVLIALSDLLKLKLINMNNMKLFRIGGDEFAILFDKIEKEKALEIAQMLQNEISFHEFIVDDLKINIMVSIASNNIEPILENADIALKKLREGSTQKVIEYKEELNLKKSVKKNLDTIEMLKHALNDDRIVPFFQPIINLKTYRIEKYEALVRLKTPEGEYLSPFHFLETSKKTPYYHEITKSMLKKTMQVAKEHPKFRFSLNISMIDILDETLVDLLFTELNANKEVASRIDIELLESENIHNKPQVQEFINELKKYGSTILIDDFGSGYSNFSYFADLDIDTLKIDGSIVKEITTNDRKLHMLRSINEFSKGMHLKTIAEFVETHEMAILLREIGVDYGQGYFFSPPIPKPLENEKIIF